MLLASFIKGVLVSAGLIIAIGAQNAFVLRQGLLKQHVLPVVLICFFSDMLLMTLGIMGLGSWIVSVPVLALGLAGAGALFLYAYGMRSFYSAYKGINPITVSSESDTNVDNRKKIILACLAVTLLNPHVYLDTVVIVGGIAGTLVLVEKTGFMLGAWLASFVWFFTLGYGARVLAPWFKHTATWRVLDVLIAFVMWWIASSLVVYIFAVTT